MSGVADTRRPDLSEPMGNAIGVLTDGGTAQFVRSAPTTRTTASVLHGRLSPQSITTDSLADSEGSRTATASSVEVELPQRFALVANWTERGGRRPLRPRAKTGRPPRLHSSSKTTSNGAVWPQSRSSNWPLWHA